MPFNYHFDVIDVGKEKEAILKICDHAFDFPVTERAVYPSLLEKINAAAIFITAYNREILGYVVMYANDIDKKFAYISLIAVRPEFQGRHIGNTLLQVSQKIAVEHGMEYMGLEVNIRNEKAICFYEKNGFHRVKVKKEFIYMSKKL